MSASGTKQKVKKGQYVDCDGVIFCSECWKNKKRVVGNRRGEQYKKAAKKVDLNDLTGTVMCHGDDCTNILHLD